MYFTYKNYILKKSAIYKDIRMKDYLTERLLNGVQVKGKEHLLTFRLIKIVLNNNLIKDAELKVKVEKFYSCYENYIKIKKEKELEHITPLHILNGSYTKFIAKVL
jgi:hypothetical protein